MEVFLFIFNDLFLFCSLFSVTSYSDSENCILAEDSIINNDDSIKYTRKL